MRGKRGMGGGGCVSSRVFVFVFVFVLVIIHYVVVKIAFNLSCRRLFCQMMEIRYCAQEIHFDVYFCFFSSFLSHSLTRSRPSSLLFHFICCEFFFFF